MVSSVYIIIVTYNGMQWLDKCLKSCIDYSIVIVDNASTDDTVSFIESNYPNINLFKQTKNLGFGQANNIGIRYALDKGAEHVFLLNQDAYLVNSVLGNLVAFQKVHPKYGVLSPIHITGDKRKLDKNFSYYLRKDKTGQFYSDFVLGNTLAEVYEVPFVNAAAWLLSKRCLETVGGFDPLFFHYAEDVNYCQRVCYHDFKIGVLPNVYVIHDRNKRKREKIIDFSPVYFNEMEKRYKLKFANINMDMQFDFKVKELQKEILKALIQLNFLRATGIQKELSLLKEIKPLIVNSRTINALPGSHYL